MSRAGGIVTLVLLGFGSVTIVLIAADGMEGEAGAVGAILILGAVVLSLALAPVALVVDVVVRWASRRAGAGR